MAKKNSSKTATEKAIRSSEPRLITFKGWQGVNFVDSPLTWNPLEVDPEKFRQTDLPNNFFMVQNNLVTTDTLGVETRMDSIVVGKIRDDMVTYRPYWNPNTQKYETIEDRIQDASNLKFTGVSCIYKHWIFCVVRKTDTIEQQGEQVEVYQDFILKRDLLNEHLAVWDRIAIKYNNEPNTINHEIKEIGFFENNFVAAVRDHRSSPDVGYIAIAKVVLDKEDDQEILYFKGTNWYGTDPDYIKNELVNTPKMCPDTDRPTVKPTATARGMEYWFDGMEDQQHNPIPLDLNKTPVRVELCFCYTNRMGSTLTQTDANCFTIYTEYSPALWNAQRYLIIKPDDYESESDVLSITGIDIYARDQENINWVFAGHVEVTKNKVISTLPAGRWKYEWYGNMTDISQWVTAQLLRPTENTTQGANATHFDCHDSRLYYWGVPGKPYRLYIGGNPGSEFSIARGLGGAWVDIEPGSGYDIKGTAKWKTTGGSNIVTILCGNQNTTKIKRFNLVETNLTFTNEISYKSYMYEEVSNVFGCNSRYGYGVFSDGLYCLNRYGLMLTTMAMEYNNQMKNQKVSDVIDPIFTSLLGKQIADGRMVCINDVIYIALSDSNAEAGGGKLGNVIFCYDMNLKAWYTFTHDQYYDSDTDDILHILAIDSEDYREGLGTITETEVRLYPVTGEQATGEHGTALPKFTVLLESGEMAARQPMQAFWYLQQLEFRFDYFIGDERNPATILVEGVDYYGRFFSIEKKLNYSTRSNWQDVNESVEKHIHHPAEDGKDAWDECVEQRNHVEWIRIDKIVESFRIRLKGKARFRLTHINAKVYQQADTIGTPYGFDASDSYQTWRSKQKNIEPKIHHYIDDYNNLRRAVVS